MQVNFLQKAVRCLALGLALGQVFTSACGMGGSNGAFLSFGPSADYGDAPDHLPSQYPSGITAQFPTLAGSNGAHHLDLSDSAFGPFKADGSLSVSAENDATDPQDPDGMPNLNSATGASDLDG